MNVATILFCVFSLIGGVFAATNSYAETSAKHFETIYPRIAEQIKSGNYAAANEAMRSYIDNKVKTRHGVDMASSIAERLFVAPYIFPKEWEPTLNDWVRASPEDPLPYWFRGIFYHNYARDVRGNDFWRKVPRDAQKRFIDLSLKAREDLQKSLSLGLHSARTYALLLSIDSNRGMADEVLEEHFKKGRAIEPFHFNLNMARMYSLLPQYGGSEQKVLAFTRNQRNADKDKATVNALIQAHKMLAGNAKRRNGWDNSRPYYTDEIWQEIENAYQVLMQRFPQSGKWPVEYSKLARSIEKNQLAWQMLDKAQQVDSAYDHIAYEKCNLYNKLYEKDQKSYAEPLLSYCSKQTEQNYSGSDPVYAHARAGEAAYLLKRYRKAIYHYTEAGKRRSQNAFYPAYICWSYIYLRDLARAKPACERAIAIDETYATAWTGLSNIYYWQGDRKRAEEAKAKYEKYKK